MTDITVATASPETGKRKKRNIIIGVTAIITIGVLFSGFFITQSFMQKYDKTQALVSYGGFANTETKQDAHVKKFIAESDEVLKVINTKAKIIGVFEQPHLSGPILVNEVTPDMKAKYVLKSNIYFANIEDTATAKAEYISYYESKGYVLVINEKQKDSPATVLLRTFDPKSESSAAVNDDGNASKAEDKLIISSHDTGTIHKLTIMVAQTPDIPLAGLPVLDGNKTISESQKAWDDAKVNKINGCTLTPNSTFGGWRAEFSCVATEDFL